MRMKKIKYKKHMELNDILSEIVKVSSNDPKVQKLVLEVVEPIYQEIIINWKWQIQFRKDYFLTTIFKLFSNEILVKNNIHLETHGVNPDELVRFCVDLCLEFYDWYLINIVGDSEESGKSGNILFFKEAPFKSLPHEKIELSM